MDHARNAFCGVLVLALAAGVLAAPGAQAKDALSADQREALAGVDALFGAMATHDVDKARELLLPGAAFVVKRPDGSVLMEHANDFLDALGKKQGVWRERIWSPKVLVGDGLAQVWAPYDFHLDGKFSHCGIDSFALVKDAGGQWRISGITYNVQIDGCPTDPKTRAKAAAHEAAKH